MAFSKKSLAHGVKNKIEKIEVQKEDENKKQLERDGVGSEENKSKEERETYKSEIVGGSDESGDGTDDGSEDESDGESGGESNGGSEGDSNNGSGDENDGDEGEQDEEQDEEDDEEYDEEDRNDGEEESDGDEVEEDDDENVEGDRESKDKDDERDEDAEGEGKEGRKVNGVCERSGEVKAENKSTREHFKTPEPLQTVQEPLTTVKRPMIHEEILAKRPKYTTTVLESILEQNHNMLPPERMNEVYRLHDSVDLFFDSVAANVKKFPNRVINEVKIKITAFMAQLEEDYAWCFQTLPTNYNFYGYTQPAYASPVSHHVDGHIYGQPNGVIMQHPTTQYKSYNDY